MTKIHSCGYHCNIPACIKRQRDELRDNSLKDAERYRKLCTETIWPAEVNDAFDCSPKFVIDAAIDAWIEHD